MKETHSIKNKTNFCPILLFLLVLLAIFRTATPVPLMPPWFPTLTRTLDTVIIFTPDNGPTYNGGTDSDWFESAKPFRGGEGYGKGYVTEGGIREPMIVVWPGHITPGSRTDHVSVQYDVMATLADLTGFETPNDNNAYSDGSDPIY